MTAKTASCTARKASLASANVREVADREEDQLPRSPDTLQTVFFATSLLDVHCNGCSHRAILREDELAKLQSPAPVAQAPVREVRPATFRFNNPRSVFRSMTVRPKLSTGPRSIKGRANM